MPRQAIWFGGKGNEYHSGYYRAIQINTFTIQTVLLCRVDFDNLRDIPILVLDVNEDFKNDEIKQQYLLDKVSIIRSILSILSLARFLNLSKLTYFAF